VHTRVVALAVGVAVLVALAGVVAWRVVGRSSTYESALATLPRETLRTTYTDWAVVRDQARGRSLGAGSSADQVASFLDRAYDLDLISGSGIDESTAALQKLYGFSPLTARWEALGQSRQGQVDVLRLDDDVDLPGVERSLRRLGYRALGGGSDRGGTWVATPERVVGLDPSLTPLQQNVVVLPDQHLVLMSDTTAYAREAAKVARGDAGSLRDDAGVASLAGRAGEPAAAVQWTSTFACEDLTMGSADESDQQTGDSLVRRAGGISPLEGLVMAQQPSRRVLVGLHFETSEQASRNLQPRVDLAAGPAPGQGGSFRDRFRVVAGEADGQDVVLELQPASRRPVLSDISTGPVLFATC
jgi:hypothetical protein